MLKHKQSLINLTLFYMKNLLLALLIVAGMSSCTTGDGDHKTEGLYKFMGKNYVHRSDLILDSLALQRSLLIDSIGFYRNNGQQDSVVACSRRIETIQTYQEFYRKN